MSHALIFGSGCFRSWVVFLVLSPLLLGIFSPYFPIAIVVIILFSPPIYLIAALEEWVFRLIIERGEELKTPWDSVLNQLTLASLWAPAGIGMVVMLPLALVFSSPGVEFLTGPLLASFIITGAITLASAIAMVIRQKAIVEDIQRYR